MVRAAILSVWSVVFTVLMFIFAGCGQFAEHGYSSSWERYPDSRWVGPDLWANRLSDWEIKDKRLSCSGTLPMRTVHLTTGRIVSDNGSLTAIVNIKRNGTGPVSPESAAGMLIGAGASLDYRAASLVFHSWGEGGGFFIGIDGEGKVFIRDNTRENEYPAYSAKGSGKWKEVILKIVIEEAEEGVSVISVIAVDPSTRNIISEVRDVKVPHTRLSGNIALVSHAGSMEKRKETFSFSRWSIRGSRLQRTRNHNTGPLVTAQYTVSRGIMKMTAQLMPVNGELCDSVELQLIDEEKWQTVAVSAVDTPSYTASFRLANWRESSDRQYRLHARYRFGSEVTNILSGTIRHDPVDKEQIKVLSLSCIEQVIKPDPGKWMGIDAGYFPFDSNILYPNARLTDALKRHNADLLFFAGDQVYEGASPTAAEYGPDAIYDYLYKWYLWCLTYRELTINIPSIAIPDDHDVYHGNLWGCGGRAAPSGMKGKDAQDAGGYKMPARFVNMVQATQTSHLPDPVDPQPAEQGIGVYFTECNIGGVSFAIIEDRKFKSAPKELLPDAMIDNGWPQNPRWDPRRQADVPGATLLGERQYSFLEKWADDWSGGTWMKAVLSQTLWANLATLPDSAVSDNMVPYMPVPDSGVYVTGDRIVSDFDSDGWPQSGRNRALKIIRKAFALHIAGDQHLPSTLQYGTDTWGDAGYAIVSPATGNIFPRRWFPPVPGRNREDNAPLYTGEFEDGFGNRITVHAVANPHTSKVKPIRNNELVTGYSSIVFNKKTRAIELANWPGYADPQTGSPFPGWPVNINQSDNYGRRILAWLPEIVAEGITDPVIRVISESTGETIYTLRISGNAYQPGVFYYGLYSVEVGDPDTGAWKRTEGIAAWSTKERNKLVIAF